ncbi:MAG TPA: hypothetical protein VNW25_01550 [Candidatus Sulfotelmatobacter sp.]|jgi:hypothetical protein|nr:hypothetical protein [Candidatus Sulfotelmatobacter sp.]
MESEPAREAEEEEIDVIWDENGTARYRILKDTRIVDFDGHNIAWLDEQGNIIDYEGRHRGFYENGILRDAEGRVVGLGQDPAGPHPVLPNKGLIPGATKAASAPKKPKPKNLMKKPEASLLWSKKMLEEL